ncbi:MAG: TIGR04190 family B12-binding domain/radical SAM domain protein [Planctomycetota bacterium]
MSAPHLILLHPPGVYDFRRRSILYGPVSDVVPSTPVFEMYPIGFLTILTHLQAHGLKVRIINVALKMLRSRRFDPERMLQRLRPLAFGIDLHWMVHAQGALELARIVKRHHPDIPVIMGGLSASFYHEELIARPEVDFVVRGDSAEEPLRLLLEALRQGGAYAVIPNLTWKDGGRTRVNPCTHVPANLDGVSFDYRSVVRSTARALLQNLDFFGHMPFLRWLRYPIVAALSCRGCSHDCIVCGGSADAYRRTSGRERTAFRDPVRLAEDIVRVGRFISAPVIVLGDLLQGGRDRAERFLDTLAAHKVRNQVALEFFAPPPRDFVGRVHASIPNYNIQISPESHDEAVRAAGGRHYTNADLERFIADALDLDCRRIDIFFMIGLPHQTPASVQATVLYCRHLLETFGRGRGAGRLRPFISPLAPFLDPGSNAFHDPARYGYRLRCRTLTEHVRALEEPDWMHTLNYETEWMDRGAIAAATYDAARDLNELKREFGLLDPRTADRIARRIAAERRALEAIVAVYGLADAAERDRKVHAIMAGLRDGRDGTICDKTEMEWPAPLVRFNPLRMLAHLIGR